MVRVIFFHGPKKSGKNTAAKAFPDRLELAFAEPLKKACLHLFDFTYDQCFDDDLKEVVDERWDITPRKVLQILGTDCIREKFGDQHFIKLLDVKIQQAIRDGHKLIIVTDCRFPNESSYALSHGWPVIKIIRPSLVATDTHESERPLPDHLVTTTIVNEEGKIDEFLEKVRQAVDHFYRNQR
jgi:hypothetical protein